jgi:hypothetical protein
MNTPRAWTQCLRRFRRTDSARLTRPSDSGSNPRERRPTVVPCTEGPDFAHTRHMVPFLASWPPLSGKGIASSDAIRNLARHNTTDRRLKATRSSSAELIQEPHETGRISFIVRIPPARWQLRS